MTASVHIIRDPEGRPVAVTLDWRTFGRIAAGDPELARLLAAEDSSFGETHGDEWIDADVVKRLAQGDQALKVWREYRGLTQTAMADAVGVTPTYISQIETGRRNASAKLKARLAVVLKIDPDDLDPWPDAGEP